MTGLSLNLPIYATTDAAALNRDCFRSWQPTEPHEAHSEKAVSLTFTIGNATQIGFAARTNIARDAICTYRAHATMDFSGFAFSEAVKSSTGYRPDWVPQFSG